VQLKALDDRITSMSPSADKTALRSAFEALIRELAVGGLDIRRGGAGYPLSSVYS
jgi:hypothetical protein